jgi:molecular chaperone GrpE (heat shock protein)
MPSRSHLVAAAAVLLTLATLLAVLSSLGPSDSESSDGATSALASGDDRRAASLDPPGVAAPMARPAAPADGFTSALVVAVLLLCAAGAALCGVLWFLLRWRAEIQARGEVPLLPEHVLDELQAQRKALKRFFDSVASTQALVRYHSDELSGGFHDLTGAFTTLQRALDGKEAEIQRLRTGHDAAVFRQFLRRFLHVEQAMSEELEALPDASAPAGKALADLHALLLDALDECGVEPFEPRVGESIRTATGVAHGYRTLAASAETEHLTIARVERRGMRLRTPGEPEVMRPARVAVYVKEQPAVGITTEEATA